MNIILRWALIYTCISIMGCSGVKQEDPNARRPVDMQEVENILRAFPVYDPTLNLVFDDSGYEDMSTSNGRPGYCIVQTNTIVIDERFWQDIDREGREVLMYHELAHCLLGIGHHSKTLMDPFIGFGGAAYRKHGIEELYDMECEYACDFEHIERNREEFYGIQ